MNNLKRILSLALASVMVMGMMVVGASAADFKDDEDITHKAAVDTVSALEIIGGYEDGTFRPNGDVTRAEMAKMISYALNGGTAPKVGLPTTMPFTDVKTTDWFAEPVMYCNNLGIIGGRGNGIFDPYGKVTAAEAAKMILVALGFDAEVFELGGAKWSDNTMRLATTLNVIGKDKDIAKAKPLSLFAGMSSIAANTPLNRDQAAQLIYNGIQSNTVKMALTGVTSGTATGILGAASGQTPEYSWSLTGDSLLASKFKATMDEGILESATYVTSAKTWNYTVNGEKSGNLNLTFAKDVSDQFMQNVRVIYKGTGARKTVLAITVASDDVVEVCPWGDLDPDDDDETLNGYELGVKEPATADKDEVTYTLANLPVFDFLNKTALTNGLNTPKKEYAEAKLIDNDGDGRIDCVVVTDVNWTTVSAVRPTYLQLKNVATNVMLETNDVEEGLAVGDYVTYTRNPETGVYTVKKAETVTGLMNASMAAASNRPYEQLQLAGDWYVVVDNQFDTLKAFVSKEAVLVLISGYVVTGYPVQETVAASNAVMAVAKAQAVTSNPSSVDAGSKYLEVRILNADNKTEVLRVTSVTDIAGEKTVLDADGKVGSVTVGKLYTYKANTRATGCVDLTEYEPKTAQTDTAELNPTYYDKIVTEAISINQGLASAGGKSFRFADDAKIFVLVGGANEKDEHGNNVMEADGTTPKTIAQKYAVVSGADVNKWGADTTNSVGTAINSVLFADRASNGFTYAKEGALIFADLKAIPGAAGEKTYYGYVTGNSYFTIQNNKTYIAVPLWNGVENVTVLAEKKNDANTDVAQDEETNYLRGSLVSYKDNGDGTANSLHSVSPTNDAVIAWDGVSTAKFLTTGAGKELKIDDKTTILYIDGTKRAGIANGNITIADYVDAFMPAKGFKGNVRYVHAIDTDSNGSLDYVDVLIMESVTNVGMMGGSTTAITTVYEDEDAAKAAMKDLTNGAYTVNPATNAGMKEMLKNLDGIGSETDIILFKFACDGGVKYTLTVNKGATKVVDGAELTTKAGDTVGIFYYDKSAWAEGAYTYTIKAANGTVIDTGSFAVAAAAPSTPPTTTPEHTHSYVWTEITAENKGDSLTEGEHIKMCATENATEGTAHAAAQNATEQADDTHSACTICQALTFSPATTD